MVFPEFPKLTPENHQVTSLPAKRYNCIAWAAGEQHRWWWPGDFCYWPREAPREETLGAFIAAFATLGYVRADDSDLEEGFEKVAIFVNAQGAPTHAARQLPSGQWSSKLGQNFDISHDLEAVEGPEYGAVAVFLRRTQGAR